MSNGPYLALILPRLCRCISFLLNCRLMIHLLAGELIECQALANYTGNSDSKPLGIIQFPVIVAISLLIKVTEQVKRLNRNIRAIDGPLEKRPKVFQVRSCGSYHQRIFQRGLQPDGRIHQQGHRMKAAHPCKARNRPQHAFSLRPEVPFSFG